MTGRPLEDLEIEELQAMFGFVETSLILNELVIRGKEFIAERDAAENGRDASDSDALVDEIHSAIGELVFQWFISGTDHERFKLSPGTVERTGLADLLRDVKAKFQSDPPSDVKGENEI